MPLGGAFYGLTPAYLAHLMHDDPVIINTMGRLRYLTATLGYEAFVLPPADIEAFMEAKNYYTNANRYKNTNRYKLDLLVLSPTTLLHPPPRGRGEGRWG